MADEKTEQPTAKRLRDARQKGQVAKSQDVPSALSILATALYLMVMGPNIARTLIDMFTAAIQLMPLPFQQSLPQAGHVVWLCILKITLPFLGVILIVVLSANLAQVGVMFSFEAAKPKLENLNPGQWFKKVFSLKNAFELFKNLLKVIVLAFAVYTIFKNYLHELFRIPQSNIGAVWTIQSQCCLDLILTSACIFCVLAALDYFFQKWQFMKNNMMSKDEVKREFKESEGDPLIKNKRKQFHQELINQNSLQKVRKAKVLIVNPTHYAVALDYEKDRTPLPVILAKGQGELAKRMIDVAKQEGIPIMHNVSLARGLYAEGTENSYIPKEFIGPVAEVLRWVQSQTR
ncbi:MAG: type III secretion system export apparatus subunit SctU [Desulfovibrionaceae bacterium]|nr:type III secretion system export apparatus subunit SctU [Desulfovibrionaceae bacterium]